MHKHLFVAITAFTLVGNMAAQQPAPPPPPSESQVKTPVWSAERQEESRRRREVRQKQGLKAMAKLDGGGYIDYVDFDYELDVDSIGVLVASADIIVRGIVTKNRCHLVRAMAGYREPVETVVTDYTIQVFDVFEGNPSLHAREITVRIPGGRVEFEDGLWAEVQTGDFLPPFNQQEFILFLNPHESEKAVYVPTHHRQGLFEVAGGRVVPRAKSGTYLSQIAKTNYAEFVEELNKAIVRRKGSGGKCL